MSPLPGLWFSLGGKPTNISLLPELRRSFVHTEKDPVNAKTEMRPGGAMATICASIFGAGGLEWGVQSEVRANEATHLYC